MRDLTAAIIARLPGGLQGAGSKNRIHRRDVDLAEVITLLHDSLGEEVVPAADLAEQETDWYVQTW